MATLTRKITKVAPAKKAVAKKSIPLYSIKGDGQKVDGESMEEVIDNLALENDFSDGSLGFMKLGTPILGMNIEDFPFCCGVTVIGEFFAAKEGTEKEITHFLDVLTSHPKLKGKTLMATTASSAHCLRMAKAFAASKYWVEVKDFKNANSGNTVRVWISNNP